MSVFEQTIKTPVVIEGVGLHRGGCARLQLHPAEPGTGVVFRRLDLSPQESVRASVASVDVNSGQGRQSALKVSGQPLHTVEHLMAVFNGLGIDNVRVDMEGDELPGMDGSSLDFCALIKQAGIIEQPKEREVIELKQPVCVQEKDSSIVAFPSDRFLISYTLSYGGTSLPDQFVHFEVTPETFEKQIAPARTFCMKEEAEALMAMGYGKGANLKNTLVFENGQPIDNELRFSDEAARHKVLDLIGDLYLLGKPLRAHVVACRTGHRQNYELVRKIHEASAAAAKGGSKEMGTVKKELNVTEIEKIIPHRYPFLLVDKITDLEPGQQAVGIKNLTMNEHFFQGHFPKHPIMPGVLIIEAMAQVGGVVMLSMPENRGKIAYFMSIDNAKFRQPVFPGDVLRMEVKVVRSRSRTGQCLGKAYVGEKLVCEAEVKFAVVDNQEEK